MGGTGRSGTWILYRALGCHKAVHTFPAEMRFIIDPGGLIDLVDDLSIRYSPARARDALSRFEQLMRVYLATPGATPYAALDLPSWLGEQRYWQRLDRFCAALTEVEHAAWSWNTVHENEGRLVTAARWIRDRHRQLQGRPLVPDSMKDHKCLKEGKHFADRTQLIALAAAFVDDLFLAAAHDHGKETWCEKTPQHLLHLDFLWELFPESVFIHVKRDPRGVAQSLTKQRWAPNQLREACLYLKGTYSRWFDLKTTLHLDESRYFELKLEDLAASARPMLTAIAALCDLPDQFDKLPPLEPEKVNYWRRTMSRQEINQVNEILGPYIVAMGYEL